MRQEADWWVEEPPFKLTDAAVDWVVENGNPFITRDFAGYTVPIDEKIAVAVSLNNEVIPFSLNPNKPVLSKRQLKKLSKILWDTGFLKDASLDPFPELEKYSNIPFNLGEAVVVDDYFAEPPQFVDANFKADDDSTWDLVDLSRFLVDNSSVQNIERCDGNVQQQEKD